MYQTIINKPNSTTSFEKYLVESNIDSVFLPQEMRKKLEKLF